MAGIAPACELLNPKRVSSGDTATEMRPFTSMDSAVTATHMVTRNQKGVFSNCSHFGVKLHQPYFCEWGDVTDAVAAAAEADLSGPASGRHMMRLVSVGVERSISASSAILLCECCDSIGADCIYTLALQVTYAGAVITP